MEHKSIVVGTTIAAFAMTKQDAWASWLMNAEEQKRQAEECGYSLRHFVAIQTDARGEGPFKPLQDAVSALGGEWWTYALDDGRSRITMTNRWRHITVGQNLVTDYTQSDVSAKYLLFLAADCAAPADIVPRMLEMDHPLCAPYITTYGLRGEKVDKYPYHVEDSMASAAAIWISRDVFRRIRWRWDMESQMSDDPCYHYDSKTLLGIPTYVRHDVIAKHYPEAVGAYESRFTSSALDIHK